MVSPRRRQVIIGALATAVAPSALALLPESRVSLVLSGRVLDAKGNAVARCPIMSGRSRVDTDADGRFVLHTSTRRYRVGTLDGYVADGHADVGGVWRATVSLTI